MRRLAVVLTLLVAAGLLLLRQSVPTKYAEELYNAGENSTEAQLSREGTTPDKSRDAKQLPIIGFINKGDLSRSTCASLLDVAQFHIEPSFHLDDRLVSIVQQQKSHPVVFKAKPEGLGDNEEIHRLWSRLSCSSIWLPSEKVYLTVSRFSFSPKGVRKWGEISFLYAQTFNEQWTEISNFQLGPLKLPSFLNIDAEYVVGQAWQGPEDPRVVMSGDNEPVVVFSMAENVTGAIPRGVYAHRLFSEKTVRLKKPGEGNFWVEKNWTPLPVDSSRPGMLNFAFAYEGELTRIMHCNLEDGECSPSPSQTRLSQNQVDKIRQQGALHGGTPFVRVPGFPMDRKEQILIGFPRSRNPFPCEKEEFYRPHFMVIATNGEQAFTMYISAPTSFGDGVLNEDQLSDLCGRGRILIVNSIARWTPATPLEADIMTISYSVGDETCQIATLHGVGSYLLSLKVLQEFSDGKHEAADFDQIYSTGENALVCAGRGVALLV